MKRFKLDSKERAKLGRREQKRIAGHILYALLLVWCLFLVLAGRYAWIQLVQGDELAARVRHETGGELIMQSPRGAILDRNGRELAVSLMLKSLFIDPNNVEKGKEDEVAAKLAPLVGLTQEAVRHDIEQGGGFVWVKRFLTTDEVKAVRELIRQEGYNCLGFQDEPKRSYPNEQLAANILGFVGTDDVGLDGIEQAYDDLIKGTVAETFVQMDNVSDLPILDSVFARRGLRKNQCKTVQLTIDSTVQFMVEEVLDEAMVETQPHSVTALVMRPKTGEILAMASRPSYNPNHFEDYPMENWSNRAVSHIYEPGSTFKSIVAAAALEEGLVAPNDWFMDPGFLIVSEKRIENWSGDSFGTVTFTDVMKQSINTCFALIGLDLGADRLDKYARRFGFGDLTGIELPAEEAGILFEVDEMRDSDIATMSIGQSIAVTPLQLITAMSAIANDGVLMKPHIVKAVYNEDGSVYEEMKPHEVRRVIRSETDKTLIGLLEQVVSTGGGQKAKVKGYRIAGKTGTAQKIRTDAAGYKEGSYIASFCGFAPTENPEVALLVIIDEPLGTYYGGQIAAPVAAKIFRQMFRYLNVEPSSDPFEEKIPVANTNPQNSAAPPVMHATVPDVIGLDAAQAQEAIAKAGLQMRAEGRGRAVSQDVAPNTVVEQGAEIVVRFAPEKNGT
ncbi:MAG: PASTA domain-containing protein [Schwartzia sp.]|nr:PASTA domain-containing protein [Schwartzia sp. (in: firmicutes)]